MQRALQCVFYIDGRDILYYITLYCTSCRHVDKNKNGKLPHADFKSCLRALGYDLPAVEGEQKDAEFEAILDIVDPNRDGFVTIQEFMAFMISRETENVQTRGEVEEAFKALASEGRPYITKRELEGVCPLLS